MKLTVRRDEFATQLKTVQPALAKRSTTLPILSYFLLRGVDDHLEAVATDLEHMISFQIEADIEEPGSVCVPGRTLKDLVDTLVEDKVQMELEDRTQKLKLECGRNKASLMGMAWEEFPYPALVMEENRIAVADGEDLVKALRAAVASAATDESRPMLAAVLAKIEPGLLTLAAVDGFRLTKYEMDLQTDLEEEKPITALIPRDSVMSLVKVLDTGASAKLYMDKFQLNRISVVSGPLTLTAQLIDLQFPDYEQIIPTSWTTRAVVNRRQLVNACKAVGVFARESANTAVLTLRNGLPTGSIELESRASETGDNKVVVDAAVEGEELEIAFNVRYMTDLLKVTDSEDVRLSLTTPASPGLFTPVGSERILHVIMPMHIGR